MLLEEALRAAGTGREPVVRGAMTCSRPFVEEALSEFRGLGVTELVVLPLYPQYSVTTTKGSFARVDEALAKMAWAPERVNAPDAWYSEPRFLDAHAARIEAAAAALPDPDPAATVLLYSAHSLPVSIVEKKKDPYPKQVEECCALIDARLGGRFRSRLGYQSKLGPVAWLGPSTGEVLAAIAREGVKQVVVCPVAFVSDHVETLYEIRMLFADQAKALGIPHYVAADGLNDHPAFIEALADVSRKALLAQGPA
jgi:ferrochelatase